MKLISNFLLLLLGFLPAWSVNTGQHVFFDNVKSLSVSNPENFLAPPVINLSSGERLVINFDILGEDYDFLRYRIIHCNADWMPSSLLESEYLKGFNDIAIDDYAFSSNTYIHYVNYNISIPDPESPILKSGNYLIQVYPEDEPSVVILQARFSVSEAIADIKGGVTTKTDKGVNSEFQQLFFSISTPLIGNINPYQDLIVTIEQNNRPETIRKISHPLRVENGQVIFEHDPLLIFDASNEYRRFETVRTDYPGMHVDSVKYLDGLWNAWLRPDQSRRHKEYRYDQTQKGRFKIDEINSTDPDLSADYIMVHFTLEKPDNVSGHIFVDGDFTGHNFDESNLMRYDWNTGNYHLSLPLKQGSYNYQYVIISDENSIPSPSLIEGNKYETENEYLIKVFLRSPGTRADRLIGYLTLYSHP